jgi:hypothetical protein
MRGQGPDRSDFSEVPVGSSVVLRGTRPAKSNVSPPSPGEIGEGYAAANSLSDISTYETEQAG